MRKFECENSNFCILLRHTNLCQKSMILLYTLWGFSKHLVLPPFSILNWVQWMELFFFLFFRVIQFKSNLYASPMENAAQDKNVKKKKNPKIIYIRKIYYVRSVEISLDDSFQTIFQIYRIRKFIKTNIIAILFWNNILLKQWFK